MLAPLPAISYSIRRAPLQCNPLSRISTWFSSREEFCRRNWLSIVVSHLFSHSCRCISSSHWLVCFLWVFWGCFLENVYFQHPVQIHPIVDTTLCLSVVELVFEWCCRLHQVRVIWRLEPITLDIGHSWCFQHGLTFPNSFDSILVVCWVKVDVGFFQTRRIWFWDEVYWVPFRSFSVSVGSSLVLSHVLLDCISWISRTSPPCGFVAGALVLVVLGVLRIPFFTFLIQIQDSIFAPRLRLIFSSEGLYSPLI